MYSKIVRLLAVLYLSSDFVNAVLVKRLNTEVFTGQNEWDYLIFTQHWTTTVCKVWIHNKPDHSCIYPNDRNTWTIHGTWPTKNGSRGPQFCNTTWLFDPEQIRPIEDELEQSWINIEEGTGIYDFWAHEWNKHGTCAAVLPPLNSEFNYFNKGLQLLKKYSMTDILRAANIHPSDTTPVTVEQLNEAIVSKLGKRPTIHCKFVDHIQYIFELRICLDKQFNLIDCSHINNLNLQDVNGVITDCSVTKDIIYPDPQPPKRILVQLYKFINWLQWLTL